MLKQYQPVRCANKECAFPRKQCSTCQCNVDIHKKYVYYTKDPKGLYAWLHHIYDLNDK